jgi:hypothetical protein
MHNNDDVALYRDYIDSSLNGEPAVYEELYHLSEDPDELVNLASDKKHVDKLKELRREWRPLLESARGKGTPKVDVYTVDQ